MKYREAIIEQLKNQPYFTKQAIFQLAEGYIIKKSTISSYIVRSLACKDIIQLKRGVYVTTDFYTKNKIDNSYIFYLANILRSPSYVSSWAALQYYDLATESIYTITSVTEKVTRDYNTKINTFSYHSINKKLFSGFSLIKGKPNSLIGKFDFFIASPSKALFDLLYFRTKQFRGITFDMINPMVEDLRIDIDEMDKKEQENFYSLVKKYIAHE
jgi:predicted transcriptional regulator of viral defense system